MTIPTPRAALERLMARLDETTDEDGPVPAWMDSYCTAVQALKAEPVGEGPSLADVDELCAEFGFHLDDDQGDGLEILRDMITAAITRWGAPVVEPATPPVPEPGEVEGVIDDLHRVANALSDEDLVCSAHTCRRAATLLQQQHLLKLACQELDNFMEQQATELAALRGVVVAGVSDEHRDAVCTAIAESLGNTYDCQRVWSAWNVGTMGQDDFALVAEDSDRVAEIADAAIEAFCTFQVPAPQAGEGEA